MLCGDILINILVIGDSCGFVVMGGVIMVISINVKVVYFIDIIFKFSYC